MSVSASRSSPTITPSSRPDLEPNGLDRWRIPPFVDFVPAVDLDAAAALDGWATGEDRRHILATCDGWVVGGAPGEMTAFTVRSPFGGVATVARDVSDALRLFDLRRREAGPEGRVRAGSAR